MTRTQAVQLVLQVGVLAIAALLLVPRIWKVIVFPHEQHPFVLIGLTSLVLILPPSIWWRWLNNSRKARIIEGAVSLAVIMSGHAVIGTAFAFVCWFTYSELRDELGMVLPITFAAVLLGLVLITLPLVLDSGFFSPRMRRSLLVSIVLGMPMLFTVGLLAGPRLGWLFG